MEYVEYVAGVRTSPARSDGEESIPSSPDICRPDDAGILGTLKAILVGGVTDLLTDYPRPTPRSVSRGRSSTIAEKDSQISRAQDVSHLRSSETFQRIDNKFTPFATDARLRASANDGFSSGAWITPNRQTLPLSPVRRSVRITGRGRGGGDVAPANSLVGSPTAGGGPAGLLGAMFSGFSSLGQRATDLLTQLDHDFETIFHGGEDDVVRGAEAESPAAVANGTASVDAGQSLPLRTGPSPNDPRSISIGTGVGCNGGANSTGICAGSSALQEATVVVAPGLQSPVEAPLKGLHVRAPAPAVSGDKAKSSTPTCSVATRGGTPKSEGVAAGAGTGRDGSAHTPVSSVGSARGSAAKATRGSGRVIATRASDGGAAAWAKQSDDDWGWGTSQDVGDDGVHDVAASCSNTTNITGGNATNKSSQVQQSTGHSAPTVVKPLVVQAPNSTAPSPLSSARSGPACSVSSATTGPGTSGSVPATQASTGSARSTSRRSGGGKLIIIKSSAARMEGTGAAGTVGIAAAAQPSPCTPTQASCKMPAGMANDAGSPSPTPTMTEAVALNSLTAKSEDLLAMAATLPVALYTEEVMPLPVLRCQSSPQQQQQEQPPPQQQEAQPGQLPQLELKPQQVQQQGQQQHRQPEQLEEARQQQRLQSGDGDAQDENERRLSELQRRFEEALADAARLAEALEATRAELTASQRRCEELEQENGQLRELLTPEIATALVTSGSPTVPNTQRSRSPTAAAAPGPPTEPLATTSCSHSASPPCHAHLPSSYGSSHAAVMLAKHDQLSSRSHSRTHSRRGSAGSGIRTLGGGRFGNDELMEATLVAQLTSALEDKARLCQENDILKRSLTRLQELLSYTVHSCDRGSEGNDQRDCTIGRDDDTATSHAFDIHHLRGEMGFDYGHLDHTPCYWHRTCASPPAPAPEHYSVLGAATPITATAEAQGGADMLIPGATASGTPMGQPFACASGSGSCDEGMVTYHNLCFESDENRPGGFAWTPEVELHGGSGRGVAANPLLQSATDASVARGVADWLISPALLSPSQSGFSLIATPGTALDFNYEMDELTPGGYIGCRNSDGEDVSPATMISQIAATLAAHANDDPSFAGEVTSQPHVLTTSSPSCARTTRDCIKWEALDEGVVVARRLISGTEDRVLLPGREINNKGHPSALAGGAMLGSCMSAGGETAATSHLITLTPF